MSSGSSDATVSSEEPSTPTRIGAGSFATVYSVRGKPFVFKVIHHPQRAEELRVEFHTLHTLCQTCDSTTLFAIPRALAYYNPATHDFIHFPVSPPLGRIRDPRPNVDGRLFTSNNFLTAAYMMDRAHALPEYIGNIVREEFYSQKARDQHIESPSICRLYFGKVLRPSQFVNPINFPLDVDRYTTLRGHCQEGDLLSAAEVAEGMGEMLGSIHWLSGFDGRDIEFIMAGTGISIRYYVVDFNQMRRLNIQCSPG